MQPMPILNCQSITIEVRQHLLMGAAVILNNIHAENSLHIFTNKKVMFIFVQCGLDVHYKYRFHKEMSKGGLRLCVLKLDE